MRGQASIEYLIVVAIFLAVLALILPAGLNFYNVAVFYLDTKNAENFAEDLRVNVENLTIYGDGTTREIYARPNGVWNLNVRNGVVKMLVESAVLQQTKEISEKVADEGLELSGKLTDKFTLILKKENGRISGKLLE